MKRYWALVLCAVFAIGCDQNGTPQPFDLPVGINPGTRLSPKLQLADDGTIFLHPTIWKDSELGECEFRTAADGMYRCLPVGTLQATPLFLDVGCTQRAFHQAAKTCPALSNILVRTGEPTPCNSEGEWSVFTTKETITKGVLHRKDGDTCIKAIYVDEPGTGSIVVLDKELDAANFVSAWR